MDKQNITNNAPEQKKGFFHLGRLISGIILTLITCTFNTEPTTPIMWVVFVIFILLTLGKFGLGIATIVFSAKANTAYQAGNNEEAEMLYQSAKKFNNIGWLLFGLCIIPAVLLSVLTVINAFSSFRM